MSIKEMIEESIEVKTKLDVTEIEKIIDLIIECYKKNKKLLIAGNGGSASDAQHFSAELLARYKKERRSLPAIALHCDTSTLTAWSNDYDYQSHYSRMVEGLGEKEDILFCLSTSGNSKNLIKAIETAKSRGVYTISLLGKDGGHMKDISDYSYIIPSNNTPRIQESHILIIHAICEALDEAFSN